MATISTLSEKVGEYQKRIIDLQNEVIEVRRENAELKEGQERMTAKMNELQRENAELKTIITKKQIKMKKLIIIAVVIAAIVGAVVFFRKHTIFLADKIRDDESNLTGVKIRTAKWVDRHGGLAEE